MLHLKTALATSSRSDIEDRLTGRFYTPHSVADRLVQFSSPVGCPTTVCDPFCGDGRLIVSWLKHQGNNGSLRSLKLISLWDCDGQAVAEAVANVQAQLELLRVSGVTVERFVGDTFMRDKADRFDLVITNPPWEQLKPDSRDKVSDASRYRDEIQNYARILTASYPDAATSRKRTIGGYNINLARVGAIAASEITADRGSLLIVLPSTIFGDQISGNFRKRFFSSLCVEQIDFYPAEAKLFSGVDQSFVTVAARRGESSSKVSIRRFHPNLAISDVREHSISHQEDPLPLSIGGAEHDLINGLRARHPNVTWLEDDLRYRLCLGRELDETRISEAFTASMDGIPFLKGRDIGRFGVIPDELNRINIRARKIPSSAFQPRLAWRDVSRPSQKRRIHACLIPAGIVTGNSLGVARFDSALPDLLETLVAVMNSIVFEVQVRGLLATNHVSQGVLRRCVIPYEVFENAKMRAELAEIAKSILDVDCSIRLEVLMARAYGVSRDEFAQLLQPFSKLTSEETAALLKKEIWT